VIVRMHVVGPAIVVGVIIINRWVCRAVNNRGRNRPVVNTWSGITETGVKTKAAMYPITTAVSKTIASAMSSVTAISRSGKTAQGYKKSGYQKAREDNTFHTS
jgi:hypothetical protein